jgi:ABC-type nitrate/sulfonate/bicarbonate transport system substrate-binding protein
MNWPYYMARDEGGFAAAGIEVAETIYPATQDAIAALLAGDLEVAHVIPDRALPAPLRAVARVLDRPTYRLFGRPGRVGVSTLDSGDGSMVRLLLRHLGIRGDLVACGAPDARVAALLAGRLDATMVTEPFTFALEDAGVPLLGDLRRVLPDFPFALCVVRGAGPAELGTYLSVLRRARERLWDPAASAVLAAATGCTPATAERVRLFYLRDGHLGRFEL